jgi:hypothetical protein
MKGFTAGRGAAGPPHLPLPPAPLPAASPELEPEPELALALGPAAVLVAPAEAADGLAAATCTQWHKGGGERAAASARAAPHTECALPSSGHQARPSSAPSSSFQGP